MTQTCYNYRNPIEKKYQDFKISYPSMETFNFQVVDQSIYLD